MSISASELNNQAWGITTFHRSVAIKVVHVCQTEL